MKCSTVLLTVLIVSLIGSGLIFWVLSHVLPSDIGQNNGQSLSGVTETSQPQLRITTTVSASDLNFTELSYIYRYPGDDTSMYCEKKDIEQPIEWFTPSKERMKNKITQRTRIYVMEGVSKTKGYATLRIEGTEPADSGTWTCKAGEHLRTVELILYAIENSTDNNGVEFLVGNVTYNRQGDDDDYSYDYNNRQDYEQ